MALSYEQQKDISRITSQAGKTVLEKVLIYSAELIKAIANFVGQMIRQATGR